MGEALTRRFTAAWWVASGLGSGAAPAAPGTAGSLVGLIIGVALLRISPVLTVAAILAVTAGGLWAIGAATGLPLRGHAKGAHDDPGWIVIDEIAGQMITLLALRRLSLMGIALAFALFRLFDITKPGPIGWADRQGGAVGIMADDILAGIAAAFILIAAEQTTLF
jgi:phosphatidylglycerophosphatase A